MKWDNAEKEMTECLGKNRYEVDSRRWDMEELAPSALDKRVERRSREDLHTKERHIEIKISHQMHSRPLVEMGAWEGVGG